MKWYKRQQGIRSVCHTQVQRLFMAIGGYITRFRGRDCLLESKRHEESIYVYSGRSNLDL